MIVIACIDDTGGMFFNHRRQSQDSVLRSRILQLTAGCRLWMNHYSAKQFEADAAPQINVDEDFMGEAVTGDYCFVEDADVLPYERWIEKIVLYRWNRKYPADMRFGLNLQKPEWNLLQSSDFTGSSHERITEEVYVRCTE